MADATAAAAQDATGWHEVEQTLTALDLPPVPPTSDPQRLLGYVLHILPRYTEMEMLATHLRLYASTLEQDMEQVKSHVRLLTREAAGEREKKQFLERYAAQVVKERNELLHSRGSSKKKTAGASHFVWHSCCKKSTTHAMDLAPSILAFRGEKLQEATKKMESLQEEVHNQELLRKELDFLLKKTQRDHDSKTAADRKHIQQLEKQIVQRSTLHSSLERKLYEVESALAKHDENKDNELGVVSNRIREAQGRISILEKENASLQEQVATVGSDRDRLAKLLEGTTESKDVFAEQIDVLSEKCISLEAEVEALRSEIDLLQAKDINDIRSQYAARINRLQQDNAANEQKLRQEIDRLNGELKKQGESLVQTLSMRPTEVKRESSRLSSQQANALATKPVSIGDSKWSDGIFDDDREAVGSSLSRSQLSNSHGSFSFSSSASRSHFKLSKEIGADRKDISTRSFQELEVKSSDSSDEENGGSSTVDQQTSANEAPFDWDTFIDSASELSIPAKQSPPHSITSTIGRSLNFSSSTIPRHDSLAQSSGSSDGETSNISNVEDGSADSNASAHTSNTVDHPSRSERAKSAGADGTRDDEEKDDAEDASSIEDKEKGEHNDDHEDSNVVESKPEQTGLARDLYEMLNGLAQKRKEEEQKASQAEQALLKFQQMQQGVQSLELSPDS